MDPELLKALASMGSLNDQGGILQDQLAQAQALRQPRPVDTSTGLGAGLGGLGNVLSNVAGGLKQRDLRGQQQDLMQQKTGVNNTYMQALVRALQGGAGGGMQGMPQQGQQQGPQPMGAAGPLAPGAGLM